MHGALLHLDALNSLRVHVTYCRYTFLRTLSCLGRPKMRPIIPDPPAHLVSLLLSSALSARSF